uniref:Uncharacterized protein n=1 Tax=Oryza sativa subsp. japonica TaxID=39947 RepID=Q67WZ4_ORYSJ|nr:hypothetical protein [Oryza sativa Japonica Group]
MITFAQNRGFFEELQIVKFPTVMRNEAVWLGCLSRAAVATSDFSFSGPLPAT